MEQRDIERRTLSALVWNGNQNFLELTKGLVPEAFTEPRHQWLYEVLHERALQGGVLADPLMLEQELARHGHPEMTAVDVVELTDDNTGLLDLAEYVQTLQDRHLRRQLGSQLAKLQARCQDETVPIAETLGMAASCLGQIDAPATAASLRLRDVLEMLHQRIADNYNGLVPVGFLTGFRRLDRYGGLHTQDLVIVGGWSSHGKTALALGMAVHAARHSAARVLVLSMEMAALQLGARMLSPEADVPGSVILFRQFREEGLLQMDRAIGRLGDIADSIFIADQSVQGLDAILGSIRLHHARHGTRLVVVDYLQIVGLQQRRDTTREEALADISRRLKNIAKELDVCVVLLSQVNREGLNQAVPEPTSAQLRGSGQINEAADLTLLVYRPAVGNRTYPSPFQSVDTHGTAMLKVEKDRNGSYGGLGSFIVRFDEKTASFREAEPEG